jgi:hypothetical protein
MDITRNWRLKTTRTQLLATRCPVTGEILLPKHSGAPAQDVTLYDFETETAQPRLSEADYARVAAR